MMASIQMPCCMATVQRKYNRCFKQQAAKFKRQDQRLCLHHHSLTMGTNILLKLPRAACDPAWLWATTNAEATRAISACTNISGELYSASPRATKLFTFAATANTVWLYSARSPSPSAPIGWFRFGRATAGLWPATALWCAASSSTRLWAAATNVISSLALGYKSIIIPIFAIAVSIFVSFSLAAMYGTAVAAFGMLSTIAIGLPVDAYGPISDNAGDIAEMASYRIRERTDAGQRPVERSLSSLSNLRFRPVKTEEPLRKRDKYLFKKREGLSEARDAANRPALDGYKIQNRQPEIGCCRRYFV